MGRPVPRGAGCRAKSWGARSQPVRRFAGSTCKRDRQDRNSTRFAGRLGTAGVSPGGGRCEGSRCARPPTAYELVLLAAVSRHSARAEVPARPSRARKKAEIAAPQSLALPVELAAQPGLHGDAAKRIARLSDSPALGRMAAVEQDAGLQRELLAMLLARENPQSVRVFLQRAADPRMSAAAMQSLAIAGRVRVELFFQCLCGPDPAERMVAAHVLGRLNRPEVSRQLIGMIERGLYRQEALVALLSSSEASAREFVMSAQRDPMLAVAVWNAKRQSQMFSPWRS